MGDSRWIERLNPVQDKAVTHLAGLLVGDLLDKLLARGLLTESQYNNYVFHVLRRESEENAARHLLRILRRCPAPSFDQFCKILLEIEGGLFLHQCLTDERAQCGRNWVFWAMIVASIAVSIGIYWCVNLLSKSTEPPSNPPPDPPSEPPEPTTRATPPTSHPGSCEKIVMETLEVNPDALASSHPHEIHSQITLFDRTIYIVVKAYMFPDMFKLWFQADILDIFKRKNNVGAESLISKEDAATKGLIKFCQKFRAL